MISKQVKTTLILSKVSSGFYLNSPEQTNMISWKFLHLFFSGFGFANNACFPLWRSLFDHPSVQECSHQVRASNCLLPISSSGQQRKAPEEHKNEAQT